MEQIVVKGIVETGPADFLTRHGRYALVDETTGEVLYVLDDPKSLLDRYVGDLVEVHGTLTQTEGEIPLLEVIRVD